MLMKEGVQLIRVCVEGVCEFLASLLQFAIIMSSAKIKIKVEFEVRLCEGSSWAAGIILTWPKKYATTCAASFWVPILLVVG